ncbi:MAG: SPOR domain-containing protein [Sulfuricurvum sp.]|nr:SPOR domain-containing protein [Sulfuricurvum sp.]
MEEKNELNDIILNKSSSNSASKKLLLAIATFTLILIIVLVIMNSLKNDEVQKSPQAILPPEPTAPTEIINDPLFEPVEIIQEGNETVQGTSDLNQVAQKIKEESLQNVPVAQNTVIEPVAASIPAVKSNIQAAPVAAKPTPAPKPVKIQPTVTAEKAQGKPVIKQNKPVAVKAVQPKKTVSSAVISPTPVNTTPKETAAPVVTPKTSEAKTETKASTALSTGAQVTYYIQVGSFTNEPNKALFDRLNASGMKYTTQKSGSVSKVLVGPFQGEKSAQDAMGTIRQNVEAKAFRIKG